MPGWRPRQCTSTPSASPQKCEHSRSQKMAGQSNPYTPITFSAVLPLKNGIFTVNMHTIKWGWAYLRKKITVNMPPLKSSLIKPSKSMLFFHIWNANFSVTPINSQMYMTKPKQVQKKLSENTGKTFSVIMPSFTCRGWAYLRKLLYIDFFWDTTWYIREPVKNVLADFVR